MSSTIITTNEVAEAFAAVQAHLTTNGALPSVFFTGVVKNAATDQPEGAYLIGKPIRVAGFELRDNQLTGRFWFQLPTISQFGQWLVRVGDQQDEQAIVVAEGNRVETARWELVQAGTQPEGATYVNYHAVWPEWAKEIDLDAAIHQAVATVERTRQGSVKAAVAAATKELRDQAKELEAAIKLAVEAYGEAAARSSAAKAAKDAAGFLAASEEMEAALTREQALRADLKQLKEAISAAQQSSRASLTSLAEDGKLQARITAAIGLLIAAGYGVTKDGQPVAPPIPAAKDLVVEPTPLVPAAAESTPAVEPVVTEVKPVVAKPTKGKKQLAA